MLEFLCIVFFVYPQWHENKMAMDFGMLRNTQGIHAPLKLQMEHSIVRKVKSPGNAKSILLLMIG